jgi:mono/diheme cytochrome c family protein
VGTETARLSIIGVILTTIGGAMWMTTLPPSGQAALTGAAVLNILVTLIFMLTGGVIFMMYFGPYKNPSWVTPGFALLFFGMGLAATGTGEFIREATRKPYIVYNRVLGNQVRPQEIPELQRTGYLNGGVWTSAYLRSKYPQVTDGKRIDDTRLLTLALSDRRDAGRAVFNNHCNDCHAVEGYSGVAQLTRGWTRDMILQMVLHLPENHYFMPPWSGTQAEAEVLSDYLYSIRRPFPSGMYDEIRRPEGER